MRNSIKKLLSIFLTIAVMAGLFTVPMASVSAAETVQTVDVILFSGQSNMDGFNASASDAPVDIKSGTAYQYNPTAGTITNLNEGPLYYKELTNPNITRPNTVGPVLTWCKTYYEKTGRPVVAVNGAYGGTPLWKFLPDSGLNFYDTLKSNLNAAIAAVNADSSKQLGNVYLAWCQGESDIDDTGKYVSRFDTLFNALKTDCGVSKAFVMNIGFQCKVNSARAAEYGKNKNLQQVQRNMCALNDDYVMVCDLLKYFNGYEYRDNLGYHFKQYCYNIFGEEAGTKMAEYVLSGEKPELSEYTFCPHTNRTLIETKVYDGDTVKLGYKKYKCANPDCILNTLVVKEAEKGIFYEDLVYSFDGCQHTFNTVLTDATCTEPPYRIATCTKCGMVEKTLLGDPLGHNYTETRTEATCTVDGKVVTTCTRCDYRNETVIPAAGHKYATVTVTKPATCTEDGSQTGSCSVCGQTVTEKIPATGHNWGEWEIITPATKTSTGLKKHTCLVCSKEETEVIPMLNNDIVYDWDFTDTATGESSLAELKDNSVCTPKNASGSISYSTDGYAGISRTIERALFVINTPSGYVPSRFSLLTPNNCNGGGYTNISGIGGAVIGYLTYTDETTSVIAAGMYADKAPNAKAKVSLMAGSNYGDQYYKDTLLLSDGNGNYVNTLEASAIGIDVPADRLNYITYAIELAVNGSVVTVSGTVNYTDESGVLHSADVKSVELSVDNLTNSKSTKIKESFTPAFGIAGLWTLGNTSSTDYFSKFYGVTARYAQDGGSTETCTHTTTKTIDAVNATCTTAGKTAEVVCADCGAHISGGETIKALGHDYKTVTVESTCEKAGTTTTTCSRCDYKDVKALPLKEHTAAAERKDVKAATCTEDGYTGDVVCKDCGTVIESGKTTDKLGHDYKTVTVESTCEKAGTTTTTCSRCDYKDVKALPLKEHTAAAERKDVKAATCTEDGYTGDVVCKDCGTVIESGKTTDKLGHDYKTVTVESTCEKAGTTTTTCSRCDYKDVKALPLKEHTAAAERKDVKAATCTEDGYTGDVVCKDCGTVIESGKTTDKLGHDYKTVTVESTCEKAGTTTTTCSRCDYKDVKTLPLKEHTRSEWITDTPATATENGSKHIECTVCHKVLETATIPKTGRPAGDVNGDGKIDTNDAIAVMRYDALLETLSDEALAAADVNGDGKVDIIDVILILQYDSEIISEFPANKK